ncbi:MAG: SH3 domain-containing protein, partial [Anaerolineae bacterium]|nr:SH3 domain-containing protein [Anaerolineae bacterium]
MNRKVSVVGGIVLLIVLIVLPTGVFARQGALGQSLKPAQQAATRTPTPTRRATPTGPVFTLSRAANIRGGPGTVYPVVRAGKVGETFAITGKVQASDGLWWRVDLGGGKTGWVRSDLGKTGGDVSRVAVVTQLPPTPKVTLTATQAPAAAAGRPTGVLLYSNANFDAKQWELWEYNFATGAKRFLHAWRTEVEFSKDGRQIAYYAWPAESGPQNEGIWIMAADYTNPRKVIEGGAYPSFSPKGDRLAIMGDGQVYIINSDGSGLRLLIEGEYPDWSPVDNRIAFRGCFGGSCGIWYTDADAGGLTRVTTGGSDGQPAWSPDGRKLAFISQEEGNFEIYT